MPTTEQRCVDADWPSFGRCGGIWTRVGATGRRSGRWSDEPVVVDGGGFADELGEMASAVVLVRFGVLVVPALLVVEFVVFLVEEPAAVDAGEEVFEEVAGGAFGVERGQAQAVSSGSASGPT
ncbi:hypothetical protein ACH4E7_36990 [Kitasatospora sp. NPDC018058]|uniref:hypothetical protein n=1 Tax=Kitasatospora sp. NPDC018058 TaxID=3364025 RepID=UPI0037BF31B8